MSCKDCLTRREFLGAAIAGTAVTLIPGCSQQPLVSGAGTGPAVTIPTSSNDLYTLNFSDYPDLKTPGGTVHVSIEARSGTKSVFITRVSTTVADTVSTVCTHAGTMLGQYDPTTQTYTCPLHGSVFKADGTVLQAPATVPLPSYSTTITSTGIEVTVP